MCRVGILGGTFDPVHKGHLHLAKELQKAHALDEVWFIPAEKNPLKKNQPIASFDHRFAMLQLAIEEELSFKALALEKNSPSFSIDTVRRLKKEYPDHTFFLLLSEESASHLGDWKEAQALVQLAKPLVGCRDSLHYSFPESEPLRSVIQKGVTSMAPLPVESTHLRALLSKSKKIIEFLPEKVMDYILENNLYFVSK